MTFYSGLAIEIAHTDQELLSLLRQGDKDAFTLIYRRYVRTLYQAANKRLQDPLAAEDLVQDLFYRLWERHRTLQVDNLGAYLHTAMRYQVLNHISRTRKPMEFFAPLQDLLTDLDTPENQLIAKQLLDLVHAYAATLPEKRRAIFLLHIRDKLSAAEIAEKLNISPKTVHNQLGAAMKGLRTHLAPVAFVLLNHFL